MKLSTLSLPRFTPSRWLLTSLVLAVCALFSAYAPQMMPPPPGLTQAEAIGPYLNGKFPALPPTGSGPGSYELENAFPNLTFIDPLALVEVPGQNKFMVLGKNGQIWSFANDPATTQKTLMLDISARTIIEGDGGALGMALHPEFGQAGSPNRGYVYIWYRFAPILQTITGPNPQGGEQYGYLRLSRFTMENGSATLNPASEYILIQQFDRNCWHNGGDMFFGPDGFLYVSVGDEGGANDDYNVTQRINQYLLGGVLRIDVDQRGGAISHPIRRQPRTQITPPAGWPQSYTQGYFIPNDNPWLNENGSQLEEFYAIGLRSPHRMTYDAQTGDIWVGDIGQGAREEVDVIHKEDNLQWPFREGMIVGPRAQPNPLIGNSKGPVYDYGRDVGTCIIGGYLYRGSKFPDLTGRYLFGDHTTLNVYTLTPDGTNAPIVKPMLNVPYGTGQGDKAGISSFGLDNEGNIYILKLNGTGLDGGLIYKLKAKAPVPDPPATLSELGVFTDFATLATAPGIIPYGVNSPLWSDRAAKNRWVALPNDGTFNTDAEKVEFRDEDYWQFPAGTVFIKHFDLPLNEGSAGQRKKLETRFFVVTEDDGAYGVTYKWNDAGTEAYLLTGADTLTSTIVREDGSTYRQTWDFPSREQCMTCHNANAGHVLGVKTRQLNGDLTYGSGVTSNQLETWAHLGIFDKQIADPAQYPRSAPMTDANSSPEFRVRSYIDANCAFCHRPNGVEGAFDARALTALYDQNLIYEPTISHSSPVNSQVIVPGQPLNSVLYNRDLSTGIDAMPPIAKNMADQTYVTVLNEWITELPEGFPATVNSGWYNLEVRHSGKVASVSDASMVNGAQVTQEIQTQADNHKWNLQLVGGNKYRILAGHSNQALTLLDWNPQKGTEVVQQPWAGRQNQMWYFEDAGDGYYYVINAYSGLTLDIFGAQTGAGAKVITWEETRGQNQQWKLLPAAPPACNGEQITYLSDMPWVGTPENGWGVVERDRSNGELGDEDGGVITLNGVTYEKGLGAHAYSVIEYELGGQYEQFLSSVGLDDETGDGGSVQFVVMADGVEIYESPVVHGYSKAVNIELDIEGVQLLSLIMLDGGDGNGLDHGDWADARVSRCGKKPGPVSVLVYPNPTDYTEVLHIEYTQLEEHVISMELFDTQGRIVYESTSAKGEYEGVLNLPVEALGSGIYILRVSGKDWSETRRVFVK